MKKTGAAGDCGRMSRRGFLGRLWLWLGVVAFAEMLIGALSFLRPGRRAVDAHATESFVETGPVDRFALNSVTAFVSGKFYLARLEDGGFLAFSRRCTHLGCTVPWVEKEARFACPCHSSAYDIRGEVISRPAPRALDLHRVIIENNVVKVDVSKVKRRSSFDPDQVTYPESG